MTKRSASKKFRIVPRRRDGAVDSKIAEAIRKAGMDPRFMLAPSTPLNPLFRPTTDDEQRDGGPRVTLTRSTPGP